MKREDVKVGMKLTVRDDLVNNKNYNGLLYASRMGKFANKKVEIVKTDAGTMGNRFRIKEDNEDWFWDFEMFKESQTPQEPSINSQIKKVLINGQATIVFFTDGTKSVVVHNDDLPYDKEKAIALAIAKKFLGGYTAFKEVLDAVESQEKFAIVMGAGSEYTTYTAFFKGEYAKYLPKYVNSDHDEYISYNSPHRPSLYNGERVKVLVVDGQMVIIEKKNGTIGLIATCGLKFI